MPNNYKTEDEKSNIKVVNIPTDPVVDTSLDIVIRYDTKPLVFDENIDKDKENLFLGTVEQTEGIEYKPLPDEGPVDFSLMGQSTSRKADQDDLERDRVGFTNLNLHRRIDAKLPEDEDEITPRNYKLAIHKYNSYRTTEIVTHMDYMDFEKIYGHSSISYVGSAIVDINRVSSESDIDEIEKIRLRFREQERKEIP